jgi:hypothetical protein
MYNHGTEQAAFSLTYGTHVMTIDGCVLTSHRVKPQKVFGQLHDGEHDVIELLADGKKQGMKKDSIVLCYRFLGSTRRAHLDDCYLLGTPYRVKLTVSDGLIRITYDGRLLDTQRYTPIQVFTSRPAITPSRTWARVTNRRPMRARGSTDWPSRTYRCRASTRSAR